MKIRMHNGSRLLSLLLAVVLVFTLTVPALAADKPQDMNLRIAVMSDLHYLSPDMIADTADFEHALNSDRKLLKESSAILYEKFEQVRADKPDILLVSGDLTKDGEQECHAALAKQLQQLQQDIPGLKIYVINGNHDIRNYNAKNFNTPDGKAVPATRTHPEDFKRIYDFVYSDPTVIATFTPAAGNEAGGLSYVARPVEGLTIIAMDTCRYSKENTSNGTDEHETSGAISAELEKWVIDRKVAVMKEEGITFVTGTNVGKDVKASKLLKEYDRVILACGAKNPRDIKAPGRDAKGIYFAVDFLKATTKSLLDSELKDGSYISAKGKKVVIIGGGDTGNDCVGTSIRHGCASVTQLEMMPQAPAKRAENNPWPEWPKVLKTDYGQEEAIAVFGHDPRIYQTTVKEFLKDKNGNLCGLVTVKLEPKRDEKTGRVTMTEVAGSEQKMEADLVLIAAGILGTEK